jgi:hypothetical protein
MLYKPSTKPVGRSRVANCLSVYRRARFVRRPSHCRSFFRLIGWKMRHRTNTTRTSSETPINTLSDVNSLLCMRYRQSLLYGG